MLVNRFFELRFQTRQSIEKLVVASKNPELTNHTNIKKYEESLAKKNNNNNNISKCRASNIPYQDT